MILTKVSAGHFTGAVGKSPKIQLRARDPKVLLKSIAAAFGDKTVPVAADDSVAVKLAAAEQPLTFVYAASQQGAWVDLFEIDNAGEQRLRASTFDPNFPSITIFLQGV
jgi:hypothetical protein